MSGVMFRMSLILRFWLKVSSIPQFGGHRWKGLGYPSLSKIQPRFITSSSQILRCKQPERVAMIFQSRAGTTHEHVKRELRPACILQGTLLIWLAMQVMPFALGQPCYALHEPQRPCECHLTANLWSFCGPPCVCLPPGAKRHRAQEAAEEKIQKLEST